MRLFKSVNGMIILTLAGVLILSGLSLAEEKSWNFGGVEYRLPRPAEEIQIPAGLPEYHVVVPGDCLWFIAKHYMNDPFLWPLVWEENLDTIENPHLIYPDQHVRLPTGTVVSSGSEPLSDESGLGEEIETEDVTAQAGTKDSEERELKPHSVCSRSAVIASGFITKDKLDVPKIIGSENISFDLSVNDIIFINAGSIEGINPDFDYYVIHKKHKVFHPVTGKYVGVMVHVMAEVKTLCVNDDSSSAIITESYHSVQRGDLIIPKEDLQIPKTLGSPPSDRCNPSTKQMPGTLIESFEGGEGFSDAVAMAEGSIAYIDLGSKDGVAPGDYFTIFKRDIHDKQVPRFVSGEMMVVKVKESTSTVVVTQSKTAIFIGDQIELKQ